MIVTRKQFEKICLPCPLLATVPRENIRALPNEQVLLDHHFDDVCPQLLVSQDCADPEGALQFAKYILKRMDYVLHPWLGNPDDLNPFEQNKEEVKE